MANEKITIVKTDENLVDGSITVFMSDGRACKFDRYDIERNSLQVMMEHAGLVTDLTDRVDVMQGGKKVGEMPSFWTPGLAKSTSRLYDYRRGDLTLINGKWEAAPSLGGGDLDMLVGFIRKVYE